MHFNLGGSTPTNGQPKQKREPFSTVPFSRDSDFVHRPSILAWICNKCAAPASRAALVGLGGVGKSQLAIQYCYDVWAASPQTWVFWVHASTRARFEGAYRDIADRLELPGRNDPKTNTLKLVRDWLCNDSNGSWTMVLDNADDAEVFYPKRKRGRDDPQDMPVPLATFLSQSHNGSILVTSRSKDAAVRLVGSSRHIKEVQAMDEDQAVQLLQNKLEDTSDKGGMIDLIRILDRIPLAISQAAAYINRGAPRMTISKYLDGFWKNDKKKGSLLNRDAGDLRRDVSASNSVVTTWQMSFEQIRDERRSAADLLSLMSFFNPQGIPESVLRKHLANKSGSCNDDDDSEFCDDLDTLRAYSLVTMTADSDVCEMHPLIQFCTRVWLSSFNEVEQWQRKFLTLMAREFPNGKFEHWTKRQTLFPHIESILQREPAEEELLEDWCEVLSNGAGYMWMKGNYQAAESMASRAVRTRERIEGRDGLGTLRSVSILALALQYQGKYEAAEEMNQRVLKGREKVLGNDHPNTLTSVSNLALVLQYQGKYKAAEEMSRRALKGYKKALGNEHPDTLTAIDNLAGLLQDQAKYKAAEEMNRRALAGREKVLGNEHPNTLTSVNNLAILLHKQQQNEAASELYLRASNGFKRVLGAEHPTTVTCFRDYSSLIREMQHS